MTDPISPAYLKGFENDAFISYSHADNRPFGEAEQRWVSDFHEHLETRVRAWLGKPTKMWRDPKLSGADLLNETIARELRGSALLISVVSPSWIASDYCKAEFREFLSAASGNSSLEIGTKSRLLKVLKLPVDRARLPVELDRVVGFEFFTADKETGRPRELSFHPDPAVQRTYWAKVDDVAFEIKQLIEAFGGSSGSSGPPASSPPDQGPGATRMPRDSGGVGGGPIFVASTSLDVRYRRDQLVRELRDRGVAVLSSALAPSNDPSLEPEMGNATSGPRFSVHIFGVTYDETAKSDYDDAESANLPGIVWISSGGLVSDPRQKAFLTRIRSEARDGCETLEGSFELLKELVAEKLVQRPKPMPLPNALRAISVYIICDQHDLNRVSEVVRYMERRGLVAMRSLFDGNPTEMRLNHQESLKVCDVPLIHWGVGDVDWFRTRTNDFIRSAALRRSRPWLAKGILVVEPFTPAKDLVLEEEPEEAVKEVSKFVDRALRLREAQ